MKKKMMFSAVVLCCGFAVVSAQTENVYNSQRAMDMRSVFWACTAYNDIQKEWPTSILQVSNDLPDPTIVNEFGYNRPDDATPGDPHTFVVLYERVPESPFGQFVAFVDGRVEFVPNSAIKLR